jgi:hypothetical protein
MPPRSVSKPFPKEFFVGNIQLVGVHLFAFFCADKDESRIAA